MLSNSYQVEKGIDLVSVWSQQVDVSEQICTLNLCYSNS